MRRLGHEPPHEFNGPLDRGRRLANEKESARGDEKQGGERDRHERGDEIGVLVFQLDPVRHRYRDELKTGCELEPKRVQPERLVLRERVLERDLTDPARVFCRPANPCVGVRRLYRISPDVEEVENTIGNVELVYGIDDAPPRSRPLHLPDPGGPHQLQRRALE